MRKITFFIPFLLLVILASCGSHEQYRTGKQYHGFTLIEKRFVDETNAECLLFRHDKSGAELLKIQTDDPNKLFNIAFKTTPDTDYGTPHILEHSLLNGSENFPVKSPFDVLMKGSLNTFLNAFTGSDFTTFPVASMNEKDYFNLMHVYLDAVLNPLIYEDPRILKQEGWHYELESPDNDIVYKGVVYNEMKGAFSNPSRELDYRVNKILFPDNTYGVSSGGYPNEIPKLTYDYFINFHKKYYHPGNSRILLYGDADLDKELEFIDSEYLSKYDQPTEKIEIPLQKPFEDLKEAECTYAVPEGADTTNQTFLNLSFVIGQNTDRALCMQFDVIADALVNHESAPLRLALQEKGIGRDVSAYFSEHKQNVFEINVKNANPGDKELFKETVFNTIEEVAEKGFDKTTIEGILNRTEFRLKEGNTNQKGLMYFFQSYSGWFFADDPFLGLEFNKPLSEAKKALTTNILEEAMKDHLLNNPHAVLMVMKPEPGLQAKLDKQTKEELAAYKKSLTEAEKQALIEDTKALVDYQKREDSPEALATIPMLELKDISPDIEWFGIDEKTVDSVKVLHHNTFTNNILYSNLYFNMYSLPKELIPYASLLSELLGKLNTENYSFGDLDNALNIHTGGFNSYQTYFFENHDDNKLIPKFVVYGKATTEKADKLFELTDEILQHSVYADKDRLKDLLTRHHAQLESDIKNNGLSYAMSRLTSYYSNAGMLNEETSGMDYYNFITGLFNNFDSKSDEIIAKLEETASLLFNKQNMIAAITCDDQDFTAYSNGLTAFADKLKDGKPALNHWDFDFEVKNEGLKSASKVQYVVKGYNFKKLGYEYNGKMKVLNQILSRDWLQTQIRVVGGAYGGFSGISPTGNVYFASYRDPNLKETFENYDNTPGYLDTFEADSTEMTRYIIGTISNIDQPLTASQKGSIATRYYFEKTSPEELKTERAAVLSTTAEDIKAMKQMVADILKQDVICAYGNEEKIQENAGLFKHVLSVTD
jgi:Zn-dependent M16 (insulinase) family peptidase